MKLGFSSFVSDYFQQNLFFKKTYVCVSGGKKCSFWENLTFFVFLKNPF